MAGEGAVSTLNWDDGRLLTLNGGQSARCTCLSKGEIYAVLLYNSSEIDQTAGVIVVWSNNIPPMTVDVPGTTGDAGSAGMLFISGSDTNFITISLGATSTAQITAAIVSVSMPTNADGIKDEELPADGSLYPFQKLTRYHAVPPTGWSELSLVSTKTQFISIQMRKSQATVIVLNEGIGLYDGQVYKLGVTARAKRTVQVIKVPVQTYTNSAVKGDGLSWIWVTADSEANSEDAKIALQLVSMRSRQGLVKTTH